MTNKLPKPLISAKCGICFQNLSWCEEDCYFQCEDCQIRVDSHQNSDDLKEIDYSAVFIDPDTPVCKEIPIESYKKVRHLRENEDHKRFFAVYSYVYFPCVLPQNHKHMHYHPFESRYSEEAIDHHDDSALPETPAQNIED